MALRGLQTINIHQFFRKAFIDRLVNGLMLLVIAVIAFTFFSGIRLIRKERLNTARKVAEFSASVDPLVETLSKPPPAEKRSSDYAAITKAQMMGEIGAKPTPASSQGQKTSNLPLSLVGTFITQGAEPYAIIEEQKKRQQDIFLIGDKIFDEAKLISIQPEQVEIERDGKTEVLLLDTGGGQKEGPGGISASGQDQFEVDEGELDRALENLPLLLTQARAVPYFKDGKAIGLRLFAIKTGSLFEKLGLQNGDILKTVNGNSLADLSQAMQLFQRLKDERSISVVMERNMQEKELRYQIR